MSGHAPPGMAQSSQVLQLSSCYILTVQSWPGSGTRNGLGSEHRRSQKAVNAAAAARNLPEHVQVRTRHVASKALTPVRGVLVVPVTGLQEHL